MKLTVLTLFPELIETAARTSILGRAISEGRIELSTVNIRDFSGERHGRVDDYTYGGGAGMLMQAEPVFKSVLHARGLSTETELTIAQGAYDKTKGPRVIYLTPQGRVLDQSIARELSREEELILLCGHYEGIDERVLDAVVTDEISIGDYVLTGGELPALVLMDVLSRFIPGVLGNEESAHTDSFENGLLEYPQYTRPENWRGETVPSILLSGDHGKVDAWRLERSLEKTKSVRPELYESYMKEHPPKEKRRKRKPKDASEMP